MFNLFKNLYFLELIFFKRSYLQMVQTQKEQEWQKSPSSPGPQLAGSHSMTMNVIHFPCIHPEVVWYVF